MNRITKFTLAALAASTLWSIPAFASAGIFGTGVVLTLNIGGSSTLDLFETTLLGDPRQNPNTGGGGVSLGAPNLVTSGGWSNTGSGGPSLGTFNTVLGDTLTLDGAEVLTNKNSGSNVTGALLGYAVDGIFAPSEKGLAFNEDNVNGTGGDQRWYSDNTVNSNILNGLSFGTHTLTVYYHATTTSDGDKYENNGGGNFTASFTVIPEPSSIMMLVSASALGSFYLVRRRRA